MTDPEAEDYDPCIQKMSDVLETCTNYAPKDFNTLITPHMQNNFSTIFQNIDGNKTNFDAFSLELERISTKFQIIGLAETNISAEESHVYQLEGYNSFYQSKHINKAKGTGVAIYVNKNLNAVVNDNLSWVTKNLETLFVTLQHSEPLHIGVLYRPPSGDSTEALNEIRKIVEMCPKKNVYILGDFNINMHDDKSSKLVDDFENIIFGLGDYLKINPIPSFTDYLPTSIPSSIYLRECDCQEIMGIISELKNGKSSDIPIHVVKKSSTVIVPYLVKYFNSCMIDGYFPRELKTGRISPIYKKEDEQLLENYRPVSTLPVFGKILEKVIYSRLYSFLISKGLINENQFGFRKGHSTSNALNYSVEHIESLLAQKQHVLGIFIDLSKAFDTIDHRKLLAKL
ncbi:hypothetical protein ACHWQZ_G011676 [Mnemiopsis leidyi]